jgi:hypothetical protein
MVGAPAIWDNCLTFIRHSTEINTIGKGSQKLIER